MRKIIFFLLSVYCFVTVNTFAQASGKPSEFLMPVLKDLVAVLQDAKFKGPENMAARREKIMSGVKSGFDFKEMSKRVLGKTWNDIDGTEQERFTVLMTKLLENVYIGKFENYSGPEAKFAGETVKGDRAQVTTLIENDGLELPVHYIMQEQDGKWMVYDINIEGVSLIRNYREQFKSILRKENYEGLVKVLEEKNKSFLEQAE